MKITAPPTEKPFETPEGERRGIISQRLGGTLIINGNIRKCTLIYANIRLIQLIDYPLKFLPTVILGVFDKVAGFTVFLPEII